MSALLAIPNVEVHDLLDFFEHKYFASEEEKARSLTHAPALRVKVPTAEGKEPEWVEEPVKTMRDYVKRFRGYYCKPAALVAAEYNEVSTRAYGGRAAVNCHETLAWQPFLLLLMRTICSLQPCR